MSTDRNDFERFKESVKALGEKLNTSVEVNTSVDWIEVEKVVSLARTLCEQQGGYPDVRVLDIKNAVQGPLGSTEVSKTVPAWSLFIEAALCVRRAVCQPSSPSSSSSADTSSSASSVARGSSTPAGELSNVQSGSSNPGGIVPVYDGAQYASSGSRG